MDGENIQTIETEGSYLFINEISIGFITTHVEGCTEVETETSPLEDEMSIEGLMGASAIYYPSTCTYNTEAYYLPLNIQYFYRIYFYRVYYYFKV